MLLDFDFLRPYNTPTMALKILVVEDDIFLGDVLIQKLKSGGYDALLTRDGLSGLAQLREWKPDLMLLDIILPQMNGYEVLEAKAKDSSISPIPVIVISNSGQPVEINRALALGVKDYLVKAQFDPEEVMIKVRLQLSKGAGGSVPPVQTKGQATSGASVVPAAGTGLSGRKIMWVEDDKFLSDIIARKLSMQGCALLHATEGEEALRILEKEAPDLILLDILLSGINGFEILKRIKSNEKTKQIPVILLSNLGQKEDVEKGKELGAAQFLIKATVTLDEIVDEIKLLLKTAA
ncbi:MAG: Response regulator receiver, CheY-like protein [Parcubacteria group bacterium GW2011_GWA2_49_9]|nr:MAG: Response regulator receiver, CheY-like protein [Parcubacteria group bacterium GW2011_GWA2_49_9]